MVSVKGASAIASEPRYISPVAVADGERRPLAGADHQVVLAGEDDGERERAVQPLQGGLGRLDRRQALIQIVADEMQHRLGVGLGLEHVALGGELVAQLLEVLDDAVVHDRDALVHVRMGVALDRLAVRGPARVADAGAALQGMVGEPQLQVLELALGAAAIEVAVLDGGDAGRIIAAIFEPPQRVDEIARHRLLSQECRRCRTCRFRLRSELAGIANCKPVAK